ncbi:hypothetical protein JWV26_09990 [Ectopseudomonas toyotomiensis]|uniref:Uncharacterized protein n=1 Tax=Ectopseudomonas toyotomiensis TaxID=554344 RepID=A0ABD7E1R0_9GAMM|nr:hypothetical protein [Pseudomonas toyotomiensis]QSL94661.1 hypothetical protein JWV26_09990 [Pseudomonas toyotomiensis]
MKVQIPLTDKGSYKHMVGERRSLDEADGLDPDSKMSQPVIVFFHGEAAYEFVSSQGAGFGRHEKYEHYYRKLVQKTPIEITQIGTLSLEESRFQISDGRHRAVVLALRSEMLSRESASPAVEPEEYEKAPVPFLTFRDAAEVMKAKGWLVAPPSDFDLRACSSEVYS